MSSRCRPAVDRPRHRDRRAHHRRDRPAFSDWSGFPSLGVSAPLITPTAFSGSGLAPPELRFAGPEPAPHYRVLRSLPDATTQPDRALAPIGESDTAEYADTNAIYGTHYQYVVIAIAGEQHQSLPSAAASITPVGYFPARRSVQRQRPCRDPNR